MCIYDFAISVVGHVVKCTVNVMTNPPAWSPEALWNANQSRLSSALAVRYTRWCSDLLSLVVGTLLSDILTILLPYYPTYWPFFYLGYRWFVVPWHCLMELARYDCIFFEYCSICFKLIFILTLNITSHDESKNINLMMWKYSIFLENDGQR